MMVQFAGLFPKPVVVACDQVQGSSDGGAILLRAADLRLRFTAQLAPCLDDPRQPGKVAHEPRASDRLFERVILLLTRCHRRSSHVPDVCGAARGHVDGPLTSGSISVILL